MRTKGALLTVVILCLVDNLGLAQYPVGPSEYELLGILNGKPASEVRSSTWSIGGETLDRDYADYQSYKKYLGPLGAKRIRLQAGWAKTEKERGAYDFKWLDYIIDDAISQGVQPWLCLSYGNPIYEGGGEPKLGGGLPVSDDALNAWDNWVKAIVEHYKDKVYEWEVWNEPDLTPRATASSYAALFVRTSTIVRDIQPKARLFALSIAGVGNPAFSNKFFEVLKRERKLDLVDVVTFHGYTSNPSTLYPMVEKLKQLVHGYSSDIELMQGENGCPSTPSSVNRGALRNHDWTELSQAKWVLRRMLGDYGRGYATNVFTLSDLNYGSQDHFSGLNSKGLLKTHQDKTIDRPKMAYHVVQRVMGYFNEDELSLSETVVSISASPLPSELSTFAYQHKKTGTTIYTLWNHKDRPAESFVPTALDFVLADNVKNPVYVDLISGDVFSVPSSAIEVIDNKRVIKNIPIPDYPILVADRSAIPYQECR